MSEDRCSFKAPSPQVAQTFPAIRLLTRRQLEILYLKGITLPDCQFRVVDLSQNLQFSSVSKDKMPRITPDGAKFMTRQVRFLSGIEALHFMGIYYDEQRLQAYSSGFLQDLAGNAFETSTCAANLFANMMLLSVNFVCHHLQSQLPLEISPSGDSEGEDDQGHDAQSEEQSHRGQSSSNLDLDLDSLFFGDSAP